MIDEIFFTSKGFERNELGEDPPQGWQAKFPNKSKHYNQIIVCDSGEEENEDGEPMPPGSYQIDLYLHPNEETAPAVTINIEDRFFPSEAVKEAALAQAIQFCANLARNLQPI